MEKLKVIDSHTAGEPTRVVVDGWPDLGRGPLAARRERLQAEFDRYRSAAVNEPRGSDVIVGALLVEPVDPESSAGVIFFNNVGTIGMCGHGTIGLMVTLAHLGRIKAGRHRIETPVGTVTATLEASGEVTVENVPSWRAHRDVEIALEGETVRGDIAWGGNWFFLAQQELTGIEALTERAWRVRRALNAQGHPEVDHVELFGAAKAAGANARSFVLCPGGAYDRSPCGTGTSAKLACLAADDKLAEGETWVQESVIGSTFRASYRWHDRAAGKIVPSIRGSAFITAESTLFLDERDAFCWGIRS